VIDMRHEHVGRLAQRIDGGQLALLASVSGALKATEQLLHDGGRAAGGSVMRMILGT
jgi:hypothetical protein